MGHAGRGERGAGGGAGGAALIGATAVAFLKLWGACGLLLALLIFGFLPRRWPPSITGTYLSIGDRVELALFWGGAGGLVPAAILAWVGRRGRAHVSFRFRR